MNKRSTPQARSRLATDTAAINVDLQRLGDTVLHAIGVALYQNVPIINLAQHIAIGDGRLIRVDAIKVLGCTAVGVHSVDLTKRAGRLAAVTLSHNRKDQTIVIDPTKAPHLSIVKT